MPALAAPPLPAFVPPSAPPGGGSRPFRWTITQYRALGQTGLLDGLKTMLLDGEIYAMPAPNPPHNTALILTTDYLARAFPTGHHVRNQMALDIGTRNDPSPDLAVVTGSARDYATRQATTAVLVVEVADSSLFLDTTTKAELYATAGVADYWVLDLDGRRLVVFRDPAPLPAGLGATAYRTHLVYGPADAAAPLAPGHPVPVADLLP